MYASIVKRELNEKHSQLSVRSGTRVRERKEESEVNTGESNVHHSRYNGEYF